MPWSMDSASEAFSHRQTFTRRTRISNSPQRARALRLARCRCGSRKALESSKGVKGKHILCLKRKMNHDKLDVDWLLMNMMVRFDLQWWSVISVISRTHLWSGFMTLTLPTIMFWMIIKAMMIWLCWRSLSFPGWEIHKKNGVCKEDVLLYLLLCLKT